MPRVANDKITAGLTLNQFLYLQEKHGYTPSEVADFFNIPVYKINNALTSWKAGKRAGEANGRGLGLILNEIHTFIKNRRIPKLQGAAAPVATAAPAKTKSVTPMFSDKAFYVDENGKMYRIMLVAL